MFMKKCTHENFCLDTKFRYTHWTYSSRPISSVIFWLEFFSPLWCYCEACQRCLLSFLQTQDPRTDDAVWLHLNFFKRVPSLRILTSDATDHKADRLPPPTVLIFAFFSFLLTSCPIHLILVYHFLFRKIQLKTFLAAALAAACSLERMMLFCQMEPNLFLWNYIYFHINL